jgi:hypothetical protein
MLFLGACGQDENVATMGSSGASVAAQSADQFTAQAAAAEGMAACLARAGISATAEPISDPGWGGQKSLVFAVSEPLAVSFGGDEPRLDAPEADTEEDKVAALERLRPLLRQYAAESYLDMAVSADPREISPPGLVSGPSEGPGEPFLIVGDTDRTQALRACIKETGYNEPVYQNDPASELKEKQAVSEATVTWITCARSHGYQDLADPAPAVADGYMTTPTAVLPADITSQELEVLLGQCPADAGAEYYEGAPVRAEIGFDVPGFRGDIRETASDEDQAAVDKAYSLRDQVSASISTH